MDAYCCGTCTLYFPSPSPTVPPSKATNSYNVLFSNLQHLFPYAYWPPCFCLHWENWSNERDFPQAHSIILTLTYLHLCSFYLLSFTLNELLFYWSVPILTWTMASSLHIYLKTLLKKSQPPGQAQWLTPVIPAVWEAKVGASQCLEFRTSLDNMVQPCLY